MKFSKGDMVQIWNFVLNDFKSYGIVLKSVSKPKRAPAQFYSVYNQSTKRIRTYPSGALRSCPR